MRGLLPISAALLALGLSAVSAAQAELSGRDRFPQLRGLSGLSGAGFGVLANGRPSFKGAMAYSTPIGHTLGGWSLAAGAGTISKNQTPVFFTTGNLDKTRGNGTSFFVAGLDLGPVGSLAGGFTFLSGLGDNISTLQFSPLAKGPVQWSLGCQDLGGSAGSSGEKQPGDDRTSRSFFGAVTYEVQEGVYATGGIGTRRFQKGFASLSGNLGNNFKALAEFDGFGLNYGIAYSPGALGRFSVPDLDMTKIPEITLFLGMVKGRYATLSLVASF